MRLLPNHNSIPRSLLLPNLASRSFTLCSLRFAAENVEFVKSTVYRTLNPSKDGCKCVKSFPQMPVWGCYAHQVNATHQQAGVCEAHIRITMDPPVSGERVSFSNLELDSRSLVLCSTEGAGLILGVAQREALRSH